MSNSAKAIGLNKSVKSFSQPKKNYSNTKFHEAVDLAKFYSGYIFIKNKCIDWLIHTCSHQNFKIMSY